MRPLVLTTPARPLEHLPSYLSRLAVLHGCPSVGDFCGLVGLTLNDLITSSIGTTARLDRRLSEPSGFSAGRSVSRTEGSTFQICGEHFHLSNFGWNKVCPRCLVEDEEHGSGQRGARAYGRLTWLPNYARTCSLHRCALVNLRDPEGMDRRDFAGRVQAAEGGTAAMLAQTADRTPSSLQRYCDDRLLGKPPADIWLDRLSVQAVAYLAQAVGRITINVPHKVLDENTKHLADDAGFDLLAQGPLGLRDQVVACLDNALAIKQTGLLLHALGPFGRRVNAYKDSWLKEVSELVWDAVQQTRPVGPEQTLFDKSFKRTRHTIRTAGQEFGLPFSLLRRALVDHGHLKPDNSRKTAALKILDADIMRDIAEDLLRKGAASLPEVERFRQTRGGNLTLSRALLRSDYGYTSYAATLLATSVDVVDALADDGYLKQYRGEPRRAKFYDKSDILYFSMENVSETFITKMLEAAGQSFDGTLLGPVISQYDVGENFYRRKDYLRLK